MRYAIIRDGERELPGLMKIGDDHDDALRRIVETIERRPK